MSSISQVPSLHNNLIQNRIQPVSIAQTVEGHVSRLEYFKDVPTCFSSLFPGQSFSSANPLEAFIYNTLALSSQARNYEKGSALEQRLQFVSTDNLGFKNAFRVLLLCHHMADISGNQPAAAAIIQKLQDIVEKNHAEISPFATQDFVFDWTINNSVFTEHLQRVKQNNEKKHSSGRSYKTMAAVVVFVAAVAAGLFIASRYTGVVVPKGPQLPDGSEHNMEGLTTEHPVQGQNLGSEPQNFMDEVKKRNPVQEQCSEEGAPLDQHLIKILLKQSVQNVNKPKLKDSPSSTAASIYLGSSALKGSTFERPIEQPTQAQQNICTPKDKPELAAETSNAVTIFTGSKGSRNEAPVSLIGSETGQNPLNSIITEEQTLITQLFKRTAKEINEPNLDSLSANAVTIYTGSNGSKNTAPVPQETRTLPDKPEQSANMFNAVTLFTDSSGLKNTTPVPQDTCTLHDEPEKSESTAVSTLQYLH